MAFNQLNLYSEFKLYGKLHKVVAINPPEIIIKRPDGEELKMRFSALVAHPTFVPQSSMKKMRKEREGYSFLTTLTEKKRAEVSERFEMIQPLLLLEQIKANQFRVVQQFMDKYVHYLQSDEILEELHQETLIHRITKHRGVSRATLMRYLSSYRKMENQKENGGLEGLISDKGKGYGGRKDNKRLVICHPDKPDIVLDTLIIRKNEKQMEIIKDVIEKKYLNKYRMSKASISEEINNRCAKEDEDEISYSTISDLIDRIDEKAKVRLRNLKLAKANYDEVSRGYADRDAMYPLDMIQIDHTQLDLQAIDPITGATMRPWITLGIDVYSRMPWCLYVSFEPPSINVVRKAIQHGVFVKNIKQELDTEMEWEAFGIPNVIYVDNGMDFKSSDIKRLVNESLKSEIMHRPVRLPRYGAIIERLFQTINSQLIHNILGTTKSNIFDRGDIDSEKDACLTLDQVRRILTIFLTDIYPIKEHKGLPIQTNTPLLRYYEGIQEVGYPDWISKDEEERYKIEFLLTDKKPYTRDGVRWNNRIYKWDHGDDLVAKRDVKYKVKMDIDDVSIMYLLHPKTNEFIKLQCSSPPYESVVGMNDYTYKQIRKLLKKEGQQKKGMIPGRKQISRASEKIAKEISDGFNNRKTIFKKISKLGSSVTVSITNSYLDEQTTNQKNARSMEEQLLLMAKHAEQERKSKES